ncbi:nuclear transport factor 2 family protein [Parahaliea sp. F7430]|uniref:Nuclear transport factor 2 family protein n=1 Tax=Sediminihaliea albiluteola TaxID=2758564 RepID=A0A7W2YJ45_9GAMM|nr:nuclear transport factor 2 family protein [Sediminihaliea albiluteola]MBA6413166.1 nuclear transport factor 2 family protein [Sediminihaliea albiluteola]
MTIGIDVILAERAIYRNLVAFARAMDERDWSAFAEFTTEDMTAELGAGELEGRDVIVSFMRSFLDNCGPTQHLLGNVMIDVDGDSATSSAYVSDMHLGNEDKADMSFFTLGRYYDEWRKVDDCWRMVRRVKKNQGYVGSLEIFNH